VLAQQEARAAIRDAQQFEHAFAQLKQLQV